MATKRPISEYVEKALSFEGEEFLDVINGIVKIYLEESLIPGEEPDGVERSHSDITRELLRSINTWRFMVDEIFDSFSKEKFIEDLPEAYGKFIARYNDLLPSWIISQTVNGLDFHKPKCSTPLGRDLQYAYMYVKYRDHDKNIRSTLNNTN